MKLFTHPSYGKVKGLGFRSLITRIGFGGVIFILYLQ